MRHFTTQVPEYRVCVNVLGVGWSCNMVGVKIRLMMTVMTMMMMMMIATVAFHDAKKPPNSSPSSSPTTLAAATCTKEKEDQGKDCQDETNELKDKDLKVTIFIILILCHQ